MFIQTEATPNPATLKFLPGRPVLGEGVLDIPDPSEAAKSPLAERLFALPGVTGVFLGSDFITVTKADGEWQHVKPAILGAIMEHFMSGAPMLADGAGAAAADEFFEAKDADTVATIKELIETRGRPARDTQARHPEPAATLRARRGRSAAHVAFRPALSDGLGIG